LKKQKFSKLISCLPWLVPNKLLENLQVLKHLEST